MAQKRKSRKKNASIYTIAEKLGVSPSTVSRALNKHPAISEEVRGRVLDMSRELQFTPRHQQPCVAICMQIKGLSQAFNYTSVMLSLLTAAFSQRDYLVELLDITNLEQARAPHIRAAVGAVFREEFKQLLDIPNLPVVTVNKPMREYGIHSAIVDHEQGARLATSHVIEKGHKRIAFIEISDEGWGAKERIRGFRAVMKKHGLPVADEDIFILKKDLPLYEALHRITRSGYTAILNFAEPGALEAPHILTNIMGLRIPEDISLVSIEENPAQRYLSPPQTVVFQPQTALANAVADAVVELIENPTQQAPLDIRLDSELIVRDSVADLNI